MEYHSVGGEHSAAPRATAEPDRSLTHFLYHYLKSHRLECLDGPSLGIFEIVRTYGTAAYDVGENVVVLHYAVVCPAQFQYSAYDLVFCLQ